MRRALQWEDIYSPAYDINRLTPSQLATYKKHELQQFPVFAAILLHLVTLGIFPWIYYGLLHGKLPYIRHDDPTPTKAICFWLIPFYNLYWMFFVYLRLADRVNFQCRLRRQVPPVSKGLWIATQILTLIPITFPIAFLITDCIAIGFLQSACNKLAEEHTYVTYADYGRGPHVQERYQYPPPPPPPPPPTGRERRPTIRVLD